MRTKRGDGKESLSNPFSFIIIIIQYGTKQVQTYLNDESLERSISAEGFIFNKSHRLTVFFRFAVLFVIIDQIKHI